MHPPLKDLYHQHSHHSLKQRAAPALLHSRRHHLLVAIKDLDKHSLQFGEHELSLSTLGFPMNRKITKIAYIFRQNFIQNVHEKINVKEKS